MSHYFSSSVTLPLIRKNALPTTLKKRVRCEGLENLNLSPEHFLSFVGILLSAAITTNHELIRQVRCDRREGKTTA